MPTDLIYGLLGVPFLAATITSFGGEKQEKFVARLATTTTVVFALLWVVLLVVWAFQGQKHMDLRAFDIYRSNEYTFPVAFYVDSMSITFLGLIAFLSIMVVYYSQYYMHREVGYQKFFACLLFLMFGLTLLTVAGTLDLLMAGWEFVGICSFLLIGFYQTRLSPVRNAFKVLSVYKFCDVGLLLGGWLSHLLWHDTQYFAVLNTGSTRAHLADVGTWQLLLLTVMILVAAAGKSAQWPFSFWLSKAMEGPTPSSAIFYGSLSVHAGVLLLYRMHPIWSAAAYGPWLVGSLGLITAIVCTGIARVQSNIKGQIAYSSAANVGLIFIEMALNLKELAMLHMVANACLRCYQLLVSPSVMAYLVRLQGTTNQQLRPMGWSLERYIPPKLAHVLYVFCINDGYLESVVYGLIWRPIKVVGSFLQRFDRFFYWIILPGMIAAIGFLRRDGLEEVREYISILASALTLALAAAAFAEKKSAVRAWNTASLSAFFAGLTVFILNPSTGNDVAIYASGIVFFWVIGLQSLLFLSPDGKAINLGVYSGMASRAPGGTLMLFIAFLGVSGFPISPAYIGEDLLLHHAASEYISLVIVLATAFVINGISLARVYTKVCMGDSMERRKSEFTHAA